LKKLLGVLTEDEYLFNKIKLAALDIAEAYLACEGDTDRFDLIIADIDTHTPPAGAVTVSRERTCDMPIPFSFESLRAVISGTASGSALRVTRDKRSAYLRGREIALTEVEHALLFALFEAKGFISRDELLLKVWGNCANSGIINVYIHYLREKLECGGEKVIISSRKQGYRIAEKFLSEGEVC